MLKAYVNVLKKIRSERKEIWDSFHADQQQYTQLKEQSELVDGILGELYRLEGSGKKVSGPNGYAGKLSRLSKSARKCPLDSTKILDDALDDFLGPSKQVRKEVIRTMRDMIHSPGFIKRSKKIRFQAYSVYSGALALMIENLSYEKAKRYQNELSYAFEQLIGQELPDVHPYYAMYGEAFYNLYEKGAVLSEVPEQDMRRIYKEAYQAFGKCRPKNKGAYQAVELYLDKGIQYTETYETETALLLLQNDKKENVKSRLAKLLELTKFPQNPVLCKYRSEILAEIFTSAMSTTSNIDQYKDALFSHEKCFLWGEFDLKASYLQYSLQCQEKVCIQLLRTPKKYIPEKYSWSHDGSIRTPFIETLAGDLKKEPRRSGQIIWTKDLPGYIEQWARSHENEVAEWKKDWTERYRDKKKKQGQKQRENTIRKEIRAESVGIPRYVFPLFSLIFVNLMSMTISMVPEDWIQVLAISVIWPVVCGAVYGSRVRNKYGKRMSRSYMCVHLLILAASALFWGIASQLYIYRGIHVVSILKTVVYAAEISLLYLTGMLVMGGVSFKKPEEKDR